VRAVPNVYADPEGYREALAGVGTLFLVSAEETPGAHDGRIYGLTGPKLFSLTEAAERLTAYTGEPYSYVEEANEEAWESRQLSGDVEAVTGRVPQTLEQTIDAHPELLSGDLPG
jgi:uncharacterized protein YbjT (DUF2867 family)